MKICVGFVFEPSPFAVVLEPPAAVVVAAPLAVVLVAPAPVVVVPAAWLDAAVVVVVVTGALVVVAAPPPDVVAPCVVKPSALATDAVHAASTTAIATRDAAERRALREEPVPLVEEVDILRAFAT